MSETAKRLLTVPEAADYLGLKSSTVYAWTSAGRMPGVVRLGRALRLDKLELDAWITSRSGAPATL